MFDILGKIIASLNDLADIIFKKKQGDKTGTGGGVGTKNAPK